MNQDLKRKNIAIIRGGSEDYHRSMKSGANIILSLSKYGEHIRVSDVVIDENGNWFERGIPSNEHKVFSESDYYIDLTKNYTGKHHTLAKKLKVKQILENDFHRVLSRINVRRIVSQLGYDTPRFFVFRDLKNLENDLKIIWTKIHTPVIVKESDSTRSSKSILSYSFIEVYKKIHDILKRGGEAILEEHLEGQYVSMVAVPNYRGESLYISTPIESVFLSEKPRVVKGRTINDRYLIDHSHHKRSLTHMDQSIKKKMRSILEDVHKSLFFEHYIMLDFCIKKKNNKNEPEIKILEIHTNPHLFDDSRFDFILKISGIDIGKFVLDMIENIEESEKVY